MNYASIKSCDIANGPGVSSTIATILSPYMILTHRVLVVDKAALQKIEEVYA